MTSLVVFAHGKESGPWGSKIAHLAGIARGFGADVLSPDYSQITDPNDRVDFLLSLPTLRDISPSELILVGSSMGGYVSCVASQTLRPRGLFLLAPAIGIAGYRQQAPALGAEDTEIVMGWRDEVIPASSIFEFARVNTSRLHMFDAGHQLSEALPDIGWVFEKFLSRHIARNDG